MISDLGLSNTHWDGEVCTKCNRRNVVGFIVSDDVWLAVTNNPDIVWCSTCFDEEAEAKQIRYHYLQLSAVSWSDWDLLRGEDPK